jgi:hypothetical protein
VEFNASIDNVARCVMDGGRTEHLVRISPSLLWRGETWCGRLGEALYGPPAPADMVCAACRGHYDRARRLCL